MGCVRCVVAGCGGVGGRAERPNSYHEDQVCEGDLETESECSPDDDDYDGRLAVALPSALQGEGKFCAARGGGLAVQGRGSATHRFFACFRVW